MVVGQRDLPRGVPGPLPGSGATRVDGFVRLRRGPRAEDLGAIAAPVVGGLIAGLLAGGRHDLGAETGVFAALVLACAAFALRGEHPWADALPMEGVTVLALSAPTLAALVLGAASLGTRLPALSPSELVLVWASAALAAVVPVLVARSRRGDLRRTRIAVIGGVAAAAELTRELAGSPHYRVVGRIADGGADPEAMPSDAPPTLGTLAAVRAAIVAHGIELVLVADRASRTPAFDELTSSWLPPRVRAAMLEDFHERAFGRVDVQTIDSVWFEHVLGRRRDGPALRRVLDVVVALVAGLALAPMLLVLALLIRRDGGSALFRQERIGEGGRPFVMFKLRTMRPDLAPAAQWTVPDDPRSTRIGAMLRRAHLDEAPQLLNVLRGEMSLVGPRPEQPELVDRLEQLLPFYQRRHLIKPGITGWAQVRCGYGGSELGSFWKLCHDLFYLRHRSGLLDFVILCQTFVTLAGRTHASAPLEERSLEQLLFDGVAVED